MDVTRESGLLQFKNTFAALKMINEIDNKKKSNFIEYDIVKFYPNSLRDAFKNRVTNVTLGGGGGGFDDQNVTLYIVVFKIHFKPI